MRIRLLILVALASLMGLGIAIASDQHRPVYRTPIEQAEPAPLPVPVPVPVPQPTPDTQPQQPKQQEARPEQVQPQPAPAQYPPGYNYTCPEGSYPIGDGACKQQPTGCPYGENTPVDSPKCAPPEQT